MAVNEPSLAKIVGAASADLRFLAEVRSVLCEADAAIASWEPACLRGGVCCKFDVAGHRLYATTGELALLLAAGATAAPPLRCPFQVRNQCTARDARPLGCRVFYCRTAAGDLNDVYERFHNRLRNLHELHGVVYVYAEVSSALGLLVS